MITKSTGYTSSKGKFHATLSEAQAEELANILEPLLNSSKGMDGFSTLKVAHDIIEQSVAVVDILTMKPNSLPKARKINGGRKPRKAQPTEATLPLEAK